MKPRSAKNKGKRLQNEVAELLREAFELHPDDVKSTGMGQPGEDIQLSRYARNYIPFNIECKSLKSIAIYKHYEQAKSHGNNEPLLIVKQDRSKPLAIIDLDYFIKLLTERVINEQK